MKHCLVVDDSAVIRKVARRILEGFSFRVSEAEDGEQALARCRADMPDAILLDGVLPGMDGCDVVKALRQIPNGDAARVVICTTENTVMQIARAMRAGADEHMLKPFDRELMAAKFQGGAFL